MDSNKQIFSRDVQYIKGVGPNRVKILAKLGIKTVLDLLYYFPYGWMDRSNITPINKVRIGEKEVVRGIVVDKGTILTRNRLKITQVLIKDERGYISGVWYNQPYMEKIFNKGDTVIFFGKVEFFRNSFQISSPEYEIIKQKSETEPVDEDDLINVKRIVPIYALTESISQKQLRKIIKYTLDNYLKYIEEYLPDEIQKKYSFMNIKDALYNIHFPSNFNELEESKKRLKFDELFILQTAFALKRKKIKENKAPVFDVNGELYNKILNNLPFKLTSAQERTLCEIKQDLVSGKPMNRLIQGDVGSGKTVVALLTCLMAVDSGLQSAIMAPTEILAKQHMKNISGFLKVADIRVGLLISGIKKSERQDLLARLQAGQIDVIIGTHALIQEGVIFKNLGLVVIDEQHRFGVVQRAKLMGKADVLPHTLIMTATPIPRTLSLTIYGDTDISVIDELPPGRKPVTTILFEDNKKEKLYSFIGERLKEGAQVYAVYPLVSESEKIDLKSAIEMEKEWARVFSGYKTALVHGQMKNEDRDKSMNDFKDGKIDILVATTVIEVGIDVPTASVMVIEHAERFGLSQLHQLRGRVGRGDARSYCVLIGDPKTEDSYRRLNIMINTHDGFKISEEDLAIRGPGEFMGTRQHGLPEFKIANIIRDKDIMEIAKEEANNFICQGDINHKKNIRLFDIIRLKYKDSFGLANIS